LIDMTYPIHRNKTAPAGRASHTGNTVGGIRELSDAERMRVAGAACGAVLGPTRPVAVLGPTTCRPVAPIGPVAVVGPTAIRPVAVVGPTASAIQGAFGVWFGRH